MKLVYVLTLLAILTCLSLKRSIKQLEDKVKFCIKNASPSDCLAFYQQCIWHTDRQACLPIDFLEYPAFGYGYRHYPWWRGYYRGGVYGGYAGNAHRPVKYTKSVISNASPYNTPLPQSTTFTTASQTSTLPKEKPTSTQPTTPKTTAQPPKRFLYKRKRRLLRRPRRK